MTFPLWVSIALWTGGIGSAGALVYILVIKPIADWGASKEREAGLIEDNAELKSTLKGIRDVGKIHDTIERDNVERGRVRDDYR